MRELERSAKEKPRIGDSSVLVEDVVDLAQPPFLDFPASNIADYKDQPSGRPKVTARFLGFFGPQGALPLTTTIDAYQWSMGRDESFEAFTNILAARFLQLFFRAWSDARPIAQFDRPESDRFFAYLASIAGIGTPALGGRDSVDDIAKIGYAGLVSCTVRSASRLRRLIRGVFKVETDVEERIGSWLLFEPDDRLALGAAGSALGVDALLGSRAYSINDKIRISIDARDLEQYKKFLPTGELFDNLTDLVFFYIGHRYEFDVQLSLPIRCAEPARLGVSGQLGWTAWMAPDPDADETIRLRDARFDPMELRRLASLNQKAAKKTRAGRKKSH
ncbi:MAG: type VI secretion system baseplate subunit TssG [Rhizobiaceae bacterium]|nr:type VI secretion system baseplate subunit TssG [Rhizobiaceae bacterium]MCV0408189.1 type VI secretion system baseplate subunit TssG [Rhizobiaceae bacterium]